MHAVMQDGKEIGKQSAKRQDDGSMVRHGEGSDGSSFDARGKVSDDGSTIMEDVTAKSNDGKEMKQKYVYHRSAEKKMTEKKAE